jgi:hypothetical protein
VTWNCVHTDVGNVRFESHKNVTFLSIKMLPCLHFIKFEIFICNVKKVQQSRHRPGVALRVPGSLGSQIS